ncbi:MAG: tRNA(Ile)-lysidine synthase, partial [Cognaticolwellia sp.]
MTSMTLLSRLQYTLDQLDLGPRLAIGVSGGVDSMVLMHLCVKAGLRPEVVSLDHGLRPESASEVRLVQQAAQALQLPFNSSLLQLRPGSGLAARARQARMAVWEALPVDHVLLAHHQDDQAETVLDRLVRGAGARGLSGMALRSGRLVRPLLHESRAELVAWAERQGIGWVEDPSNRTGTRGWMRHQVLPLLEERRPGSAACIARSASHLAQDEAVLSGLASGLLDGQGLSLESLQAAPQALQRRALAQLLERERGDREHLSARLLDLSLELLNSKGGAVQVGGGWCFVLH